MSRELPRNTGQRGYRFQPAQRTAQSRHAQVRHKPRKLRLRVRRAIARKLRAECWSPEQISFWLKTPEFWGGAIPFFTPTDAESEPFCLDTEDHITQLGLRNSATRLYPKGTLFITARGSVEKAMIISTAMAMNQSCYALCPHEGVGSAFLYFHTLSLMEHLHAKSSGSIFKSIVTNDIKFTPAIVPASPQVATVSEVAEPLFNSILMHQEQNKELTELRDWLLPMLMNGQVTVS